MAKSQEVKTIGMLAHLLGIFTGFVGPLIIFLVWNKKDSAKENARHALNFQISMVIYYIIAFILIFVLVGIILIIFLGIFALVVMIIGSVRAFNGEVYRYPLEIPFIR